MLDLDGLLLTEIIHVSSNSDGKEWDLQSSLFVMVFSWYYLSIHLSIFSFIHQYIYPTIYKTIHPSLCKVNKESNFSKLFQNGFKPTFKICLDKSGLFGVFDSWRNSFNYEFHFILILHPVCLTTTNRYKWIWQNYLISFSMTRQNILALNSVSHRCHCVIVDTNNDLNCCRLIQNL